MRFRLRKAPSLLSLIAFLIFVLLYYFANPQSIPQTQQRSSDNPAPVLSLTPIESETLSILSETTAVLYPVVKVVDGDTITVMMEDRKQTIRLIGINTPETVDPRKGVECFGKEASQFVSQLLQGQSVRLEPDPTQDNRDRYGRLLRYVYLSDGTMVNKTLLEEGYAYEYTYENPYQHLAEFNDAEHQARERMKGLWGAGGCGG